MCLWSKCGDAFPDHCIFMVIKLVTGLRGPVNVTGRIVPQHAVISMQAKQLNELGVVIGLPLAFGSRCLM